MPGSKVIVVKPAVSINRQSTRQKNQPDWYTPESPQEKKKAPKKAPTLRKTPAKKWYRNEDPKVVLKNVLSELKENKPLSRRLKALEKEGITSWHLRTANNLPIPLYKIPVNVLQHDPEKAELLYVKNPPLLEKLREEARAAEAQGKKKSKKAKKEKKPKTKAKTQKQRKVKKAKTQKQKKAKKAKTQKQRKR